MDNPTRLPRPRRILAALVLPLIFCLAAPAPAALAARQQQENGTAESEQTAESKKEAKQRAKQARIEEYLRKKEERRARREMRRAEREQAQPAAPPVAQEAAPTQRPAGPEGQVVLPRALARAQALVRRSAIAQDPTVAGYLELIDRAEASPHQLAAFGNFLADVGMSEVALEYYAVALSLERDDPVLWVNVGTLHRQVGQRSAALSAYNRALSIDPNLASAHYNLGAVLDEQGDYKKAIEKYRTALTLDPSLGDPAINPQAANNERLVAVKLMLYKERVGSLGLPLAEVPEGELAAPEQEGE